MPLISINISLRAIVVIATIVAIGAIVFDKSEGVSIADAVRIALANRVRA